MSADSPRLRLSILGVVALALFAALFARLWFLQVVGSPEYKLAAETMLTREIAVEAPRGRIVDAKGKVVVDNRTSIVVTIDKRQLAEADNRDEVVLRLAEELTGAGHPTKVAEIEDQLVDPKYSPIEPVPVAADIDEELEIFLTERAAEFPGVDVHRETVRTYPYGAVAAHVIGYVGRISPEEYEQRMGTEDEPIDNPKPYEPDDNIGKTGVEQIFEDDLRGKPGVQTVEVDARGEVIRTIEYDPPVRGNDIQLTIDLDVQMLTEQRLVAGMEATRRHKPKNGPPTKAPAGSAIVLDPETGAVIAMASYPTYNPEEFVGGITTERYDELKGQGDPFTNRAIAGQYAPGSTFKLVTGYAGLITGMIAPNTSYSDGGTYTVKGCPEGADCTYQNAGGAAHGSVNITEALTVSSDVFFYWLGERFWLERGTRGEDGLQQIAEQLGFGTKTGIPLPFERDGVMPTPQQRIERHEQNPTAFPSAEWYTGDNVITAIGQGDVLATPIQLANSFGTFANGGTLYQPNLVARVLAPDADLANPEVVREVQPRVVRQLDMPPDIYNAMLTGFDGVTKSGTASTPFEGWDQRTFPLSGKTGTAQVGGKADSSIFVAFGPTPDPKYVVTVIIEEGGFGADSAAPIARQIFEPLAGFSSLPPALTLQEMASAVTAPLPPPPPSIGESGASD